ncbi:hypothetical protein SAMN05421663_105151 [Terribacillus halophilus]|uniref:Uncharacterized protein n=1 Tax=Terribacillus halophilus TaxID=361279 RepID=A0A1G6QPY2_9BACI|nr:DUF6171 family protein [Terribacillus halophilus]SDC93727.1 hypothetical protein SAMN05421663_105151 [Terribacillus halophilus]
MTCRTCLQKKNYTAEEASELVLDQLALEPVLAEEDTVTSRLTICSECPSLTADHTCMHCGCFVLFRASLPNKRCPAPDGDRWQQV